MKMKRDIKKDWKKFCKDLKEFNFSNFWSLIIFPLMITFVFLLPKSVQDSFKLHIYDPRWWQFFTASFAHHDFGHFLNNLGLYCCTIVVIVYLCLKSEQMKKFNSLMLVTIFTLPFINTIINKFFYLSTGGVDTSCGSSGLTSAFLGFTAIFWIKSMNKKALFRTWFFMFLYYSFIVTIFYGSFWYVVTTSVVFTGYGVIIHKELWTLILNQARAVRKDWFFFFISLYAISVFMIIPTVLFPLELNTGGTSVNIMAHYFGAVYGLAVSALFVLRK